MERPSRSPSPSPAILKSARIGVDEAVDETEGMDASEVRTCLLLIRKIIILRLLSIFLSMEERSSPL